MGASVSGTALFIAAAVKLSLVPPICSRLSCYLSRCTLLSTSAALTSCWWRNAQEDARFEDRVAEVAKFNEGNVWRKRGISITPVR